MPAISRSALRRLLPALALAAIIVPARAVSQAPAAEPAFSLDVLFDRGVLLHDRNGDDLTDHVSADLVYADDAGAGELAAVADVAARLAFETPAIDLPLSRNSGDGIAVVIGRAALPRLTPELGADATPLAAGVGVVAAAATGGRRAVLITGGDEQGIRAAAAAFTRLPHAWDLSGPALADVGQQVRAFLGDRVQDVFVPAVFVRTGTDALQRVVVTVRVAAAADIAAARRALQALAQTTGAAGSQSASKPRPLSFGGIESLRIRLVTQGARTVDVDVPRAETPRAEFRPRRPGGAAKDTLDLSTLYGIEGLLGDSDNNLIPDRLDAMLSPGGQGASGIADVASRLGLESTGLSFPLAQPAGSIEKPESEPTLVLIGAGHPLVDDLAKQNKIALPTQPGEGLIQIVKRAFGSKAAVVVTGADAAGAARATSQVAERFPHIWDRGKDRPTIEDVEDDVRRFLSGRSPAGQAATALYKLDALAAQLAGKDLEWVRADLSVEKAAPGLDRVVRDRLAQQVRAGKIDAIVENRDVQKARTVFTEELDVASEVDEFWRVFRARIVPAVKRRRPVVVEARLSEPPEVRTAIEQAARAELIKAGASEDGTSVTVLSAYKQGFSWLYDVVRPALQGKPVDRITIRFAEVGAPDGWPHQALYSPIRWLLEAFPVDELIARDLKIDLKQITFEKMPVGSPAYEAVAVDRSGAELFRQTFEPKWVLRPYLDVFPTYEQVRVTTGWVRADVAGVVAVDERIVTDPERFWDHYQAKTLKNVYEHVMRVHEGKPRAQDAPFFGELTVDLTLSEPDFLVGVDKEQVMSMEAIHEDLYFTTLSFFDVLGRFTRNANLEYPGRVIPIMRPKADGKPGRMKITFTAFDAPRPMVSLRYRERGGSEGVLRLDIPKVEIERPSALAAVVRAGRDGIERLDLRVKVDSERDERAALVRRAPERQVDGRIMSAEQTAALVEHLAQLRAAGLYADALAYPGLREIRITAGWTHDVDPKAARVAALPPNGQPAPLPDIRALLPAGWRHSGERIVQWDTPIPPPEAYELLAKMSTFPEATVYKVGESYLGKDIWAMDLTAPLQGTHWSQAKATALKPTVVYTARQHANEVSSTSHVLRLAEQLLTDPEFKKKLQKVNVVIHPITNPDGAQLAYDLYEITPDYSLHAGYLGSLGVDATSGGNDPDPIYPEARVRPKLWRMWLPDLFLNPHGYPHHMWIQPFSEFIGPVRNGRVSEERHWGIIRGWFMPGFAYLDDPRYPHHKDAVFELRDKIRAYVKEAQEMMALNQRAYDRYVRYGIAWDNDAFKDEDFTHGALIYSSIKGARAGQGGAGGGDNYMVRYPNVTIWTGATEAPDETAYGPWLHMVAEAGLQWDKASLDFLAEGRHVIERKAEPFAGGITISVHRPRPPGPAADRTSTSDGSR
ncbi:MAG TPA: M14 family metallopeptidase [Vicinamibacterales bacterium]